MLFTARLTGNAEVKTVKENKSIVGFTVAINQTWKNKAGEKKEKVAFVDCSYWRNTGIAEYLTKGTVVEISGWVEAQAYESKTKGLQARLNCTCDTIKLFSPAPKSGQGSTDIKENTVVSVAKHSHDDDLPF